MGSGPRFRAPTCYLASGLARPRMLGACDTLSTFIPDSRFAPAPHPLKICYMKLLGRSDSQPGGCRARGCWGGAGGPALKPLHPHQRPREDQQ